MQHLIRVYICHISSTILDMSTGSKTDFFKFLDKYGKYCKELMLSSVKFSADNIFHIFLRKQDMTLSPKETINLHEISNPVF